MKLLKLDIKNFKKIKAVSITPDGNFIKIGGNNEQGKSSILDSIISLFDGKSSLPEKPIREGETEAVIIGQTEDYTITRRITKTNDGYRTSLVLTSNEKLISSPQGELDKINNKIYDVYDFIKDKNLRFQTFLSIAGIDYQEIKDKIALIEEQRRYIGRDLKKEEIILSQLPQPEYNLPNEKVKISEIQKQLDNYNKIQKEKENLEKEYFTYDQRYLDILNQIKILEKKAEELKELSKETREKVINLENLLKGKEKVEKEIEQAEELNRKIDARNKYAESTSTVDDLKIQYDQLTLKRDTLIKDTKDKFNSILEGLEVNEKEEILFKGLPFEQLSQGQQIEIAIETLCKFNPKLRVCIVREGSLLDDTKLSRLAELAEKYDIQIWLEKVGKAEIIIEEGEIK